MACRCSGFLAFLLSFTLLMIASTCFADGDLDIPEDGDTDIEAIEEDTTDFCVSDSDCPGGSYCSQAHCEEIADGICRKDEDCVAWGMGQHCLHEKNECRLFCIEDSTCAEDEYCDVETNRCKVIPDDVEGFCRIDADCSGDEFCDTENNTCQPKCFSNGDCPEGEVCVEFRCVPGTAADGDDIIIVDGDSPDGDVSDGDVNDGDTSDGDTEPNNNNNQDDGTSGLIDCPPGEICSSDVDGDSDDSGSSSCHSMGSAGATLIVCLMLLAFVRRISRDSQTT